MNTQRPCCNPELNAKELGRALREKEAIEAVWRERGINPDALGLQVVEIGYDKSMRCASYGLRSQMVNGLPPGGTQHG